MTGRSTGAPELHLIVGPNGAGKSSYERTILAPTMGLPFVNADLIAADRWPGDAESRSYEAARIAAEARDTLIAQRKSFVAETVFSHPSKLDLLRRADAAGYLVALHVVLIPEELTVARVEARVRKGGHSVPEDKIRERYRRLWAHVVEALTIVDDAEFFDNSSAKTPLRLIATFSNGRPVIGPFWPPWTPAELSALG